MQIQRTCNTCGKPFNANKQTHFYCCRRCFKIAHWKKQKAERASCSPRYPTNECPHCGNVSQLQFDPIRKPKLFDAYACPFCGIPRRVIYDHQYDVTFMIGNPGTTQYVIQSAIMSGSNVFMNVTSISATVTFVS